MAGAGAANRFDVACCDSGEQFRREARAITRAGQIKDPGGRHEKDDRSRIDDRSRYVLGWSNADKLRALRDQRQRLEDQLAALGQRIGRDPAARKELQGRLETLARLEEFTRFTEIDWMSWRARSPRSPRSARGWKRRRTRCRSWRAS
jgi:uncharacterized protein YPO0396